AEHVAAVPAVDFAGAEHVATHVAGIGTVVARERATAAVAAAIAAVTVSVGAVSAASTGAAGIAAVAAAAVTRGVATAVFRRLRSGFVPLEAGAHGHRLRIGLRFFDAHGLLDAELWLAALEPRC